MACTNVTMTEAFCLNDGERTFLVALTSMDLVICVCMLLVGLWRFALVALSKRQLDKPVLDFQCLILVLLICFPILRLIPIDAGPNLLNVTGGFRGALFLCHLSILMLTWALIANFFATIVSKFHPPTVLVLRLLYAFMAIWGGVVLVAIATTAATGDHKAGSALANLATVIYIVVFIIFMSVYSARVLKTVEGSTAAVADQNAKRRSLLRIVRLVQGFALVEAIFYAIFQRSVGPSAMRDLTSHVAYLFVTVPACVGGLIVMGKPQRTGAAGRVDPLSRVTVHGSTAGAAAVGSTAGGRSTRYLATAGAAGGKKQPPPLSPQHGSPKAAASDAGAGAPSSPGAAGQQRSLRTSATTDSGELAGSVAPLLPDSSA